MVLGLSCGEPRHVCIEANPFVLRVSVLDLSTLHQCRTKVNLQRVIFAVFEDFRDVNSVRNEHVVAFQNDLSIDFDSRERVKAVENKFMNLTVSCRSDFWKFCSVGPAFIPNPFTFELVETEEGVWNANETGVSNDHKNLARFRSHIVRNQIKVYIGGYSLYWHPIVQVGLLELP